MVLGRQTSEEAVKAAVLTVKEVAHLLKKSERTVYRWVRTRQVPARKVGGCWFVPRVELLLFLSGRLRGWDGE